MRAGDTVQFNKSIPDYPQADNWILKYRIIGLIVVEVTAAYSANTTALVTFAAAQTATLQSGVYQLIGWVECTVDAVLQRQTIFEARLDVLQNLTTITSQDTRSYWQSLLDAIRATMAGRATKEMAEMTLPGGKTVRELDPRDLMVWETRVARKVRAEQGKSRAVNFSIPGPI